MPEKKTFYKKHSNTQNFLYMTGFLAAATAIGQLFLAQRIQETNIVLVYIVAVLLTARYADRFFWGISAAVVATFAFNFFFTEPRYTFSVNNSSYLITFVLMTASAVFMGALTIETRKYAHKILEREKEIHVLYKLSNELSSANTIESIKNTAENSIGSLFGSQAVFHLGKQEVPKANLFPVKSQEGMVGTVEVAGLTGDLITEEYRALMDTMLENIGIALDRVYSSEERYRNQKLMEQEKYRANLLRAISHDLRTPLMGIMGTSEMIAEMSELPDPRKRLAEDIYQDADWLHSLVENILGLTRLTDGKVLLSKTPEPLEEIISSAILRIEKRAPGYEIDVKLPEAYLEVAADPRLLEQVFVNLLDNAVRHTPSDREILITVQEVSSGQVKVLVMDRGQGINEKDLPSIFEMFYTASKRPADGKNGVGLGLAICDTIIKAHGGTIKAENRTGGGAVFTITLPVLEKGKSHV